MDCMVQGKRIEVRLSPSQIAAVEDWRRHQQEIPPRAVAIVQLMEIGIEVSAKKKAKPETKKGTLK
jgi:hypothetical protein